MTQLNYLILYLMTTPLCTDLSTLPVYWPHRPLCQILHGQRCNPGCLCLPGRLASVLLSPPHPSSLPGYPCRAPASPPPPPPAPTPPLPRPAVRPYTCFVLRVVVL